MLKLDIKPETPRPRPFSARRSAAGEVAFILEEDPELGEGLSAEDLRALTAYFRAPVIVAKPPRWDPPEFDAKSTFGVLILEGSMARRVRVGQARSTELLGPGDILRPWDEPCRLNPVPPESEWPVFQMTRLALLDKRITRLICQRPELVLAFSGRLLRRSRYAEYVATASHLPKVDDRLLALLWHLAGLWGRVTPKGVFVPIQVTQTVLGEMIGARRPSVSVAMKRLHERGEVISAPHLGYLLTGDPAAVTDRRPRARSRV